MEIRILHFEGCPNDAPTRELVEQLLAEETLPAVVQMVPVETPEAAQEHRFLGSPTVQIDGVDIEPKRRKDTNYALSCRTYNTQEGRQGVPPAEMVRAALRAASSSRL